MKSKAALFLDEASKDYDIQDYVPSAVKWWSTLAPKMQKEYLAKLAKSAPDKVAQVYQDLYSAPPEKGANEDLSKAKKVLMAAVLAAFMAAGSAHAASPTADDYARYDQIHGKQGTTQQVQPTKQQQEYSRQMQQQDQEQQSKSVSTTGALDKAASLLNLGAQASRQFGGSTHSQQRAMKTSSDLSFIADTLRALSGQ